MINVTFQTASLYGTNSPSGNFDLSAYWATIYNNYSMMCGCIEDDTHKLNSILLTTVLHFPAVENFRQ